jgi:hypothetical protein
VKELSAKASAWEAERGQLTGRLSQLESQFQERMREVEAIKADPLGWATKNGVDPNGAIRKFVGEGTPEAKIEEAIERAKAAEAKLEKYAADQEKTAQENREKAAAQHVERSIEGVANTIKANAKQWPYTNLVMTDDEVRSLLRKSHEIGVKRQENYTLDDLRSSFERLAKTRYEKMSEAAKELLADSSSGTGQALGSPPVSGPPSKGLRQAAPVKNASATPTTPAQKTPKTRTLTREQQKDADLAALSAARAKDAKERAAKAPVTSKAKH